MQPHIDALATMNSGLEQFGQSLMVAADADASPMVTATAMTAPPPDSSTGKATIAVRSGLRYDQLLGYISARPSLSILEIGVARAANTLRMMLFAGNMGGRPRYTGIDPFQLLTDNLVSKAQLPSSKLPFSAVDTMSVLKQVLGEELFAGVTLFKGFSGDILPELRQRGDRYDLIFIDGDHYYEPLLQDWLECKHLLAPGGAIVFDDFPNWGVLPVVASIDRKVWNVNILPHVDVFAIDPTDQYPTDRRMFQLVEVTRREDARDN